MTREPRWDNIGKLLLALSIGYLCGMYNEKITNYGERRFEREIRIEDKLNEDRNPMFRYVVFRATTTSGNLVLSRRGVGYIITAKFDTGGIIRAEDLEEL